MSGQPPIIDPESVDPAAFAREVGRAPDDQLRAGLAGPFRKVVLDGVFERMTAQLDRQRARGVDAVVHWRLRGRPGGGDDLYELVIADGACSVSKEPTRAPRLTLALDAVDFLKLATGNASGARLALRGRLRLSGDLMLAGRLQGLFRMPEEPTAHGA